MPIHEYLTASGRYVEKIFIHPEVAPDELELEDGTARRVPSKPVVRFVGAFSGGTQERQKFHSDKGEERIIEPGMREDTRRRKKELEEKYVRESTKEWAESFREWTR